jgi:hypothetical protein
MRIDHWDFVPPSRRTSSRSGGDGCASPIGSGDRLDASSHRGIPFGPFTATQALERGLIGSLIFPVAAFPILGGFASQPGINNKFCGAQGLPDGLPWYYHPVC